MDHNSKDLEGFYTFLLHQAHNQLRNPEEFQTQRISALIHRLAVQTERVVRKLPSDVGPLDSRFFLK